MANNLQSAPSDDAARNAIAPMPDRDLSLLSQDLRRQSEELQRVIAERSRSSLETTELLQKIEDLRERMQRTAQLAAASWRKQ